MKHSFEGILFEVPALHSEPSGLRRYIENCITTWCRYQVASEIHKAYGFGTSQSYIAFFIDLLLDYRSSDVLPPVIPDSVLVPFVVKTHFQNSLLIQILTSCLEGSGASDPLPTVQLLKIGDAEKIACTLGHLIDLQDLLSFAKIAGEQQRAHFEVDYREPARTEFLASLTEHFSYLNRTAKSLQISAMPNLISICVAGFYKSDNDDGEHCRRFVDACLCLGIRVELLDFSSDDAAVSPEAEIYTTFSVSRPSAPILVFCMDPISVAAILAGTFPDIAIGRYTILYSRQTPGPSQSGSCILHQKMDEVWCSNATYLSWCRSKVRRPSYFVPNYLIPGRPEIEPSLEAMIAGRFNFLCLLSSNSDCILEWASLVISAFTRIFPQEDHKAQLILHVFDSERTSSDLEKLSRDRTDDPRVAVIGGVLTAGEVVYLLNECQCYISVGSDDSLERRTAKAMLLGKPTICCVSTSAADFISDKTALFIKTEIADCCRGGAMATAESLQRRDVEQLAGGMSIVYNDHETAMKIGRAGRLAATRRFSLASAANALRSRLGTLSSTQM